MKNTKTPLIIMIMFVAMVRVAGVIDVGTGYGMPGYVVGEVQK